MLVCRPVLLLWRRMFVSFGGVHKFLNMPQVGILRRGAIELEEKASHWHVQRGVNHSLGRLGRHLILYHLLPLVTIIHATSNDSLVLTGVVSGVLAHYPAVLRGYASMSSRS